MINVNSKFYHSKDYEVRLYDMDINYKLKPNTLLNFLQDIATVAAEKSGFGHTFTQKHNLAWFLLKYRIEFDKYPQNIDVLTVKTESRGVNKLFAIRDFEIYDNNQLLARATSQWGLVDIQNKTMVPPLAHIPNIDKVEKRDDDLSMKKISQIAETTNNKELFKIRYSDIDTNQHVNNSTYMYWAIEALPYECLSQMNIKNIDIQYKKEIQYGHSILSKFEVHEDKSLHSIVNSESQEELCLINIDFK